MKLILFILLFSQSPKYCMYCGTVGQYLTTGSCSKSPSHHHIEYTGSFKKTYHCKYCSVQSTSIASLTSNKCKNNPESSWHVPSN